MSPSPRINLNAGWLMDSRISAPMRVLMAIEAMPSWEQPSKEDIVVLTGLSAEEVSRTIRRATKEGLLTASLKTMPGRLNAEAEKLLEEKHSEYREDRYPEVFAWASVFDPLFQGELLYLRDLADAKAREFWRFLSWNCRKNVHLNVVEGTARENLALVVACSVGRAATTKERWRSPNHGLSSLVRGLSKDQIEAVRSGPGFRTWLKRAEEKKLPTVRSEVARLAAEVSSKLEEPTE